MIRDTELDSHAPGVTSNEWHVVHARWNGAVKGEPLFERTIVSEHRTRYAHEGEGGRFSELVEEDLTDGAWVARRIVKRTYEAGRLVTIETKNPLDPNGEYYIETFIYEPGGHITDIDRAGYNRDGSINDRPPGVGRNSATGPK